ncbi:MAG: acyltransferase [Bacteroidales bacterium]|nr:acyltransferase [Bacteroidales bacterium]
MTKTRLVSIDMMVGMAMILVVLGHMSVGNEPYWYSHGLHNWIYSFHMELFLFLSAFLIRYSFKGVSSAADYGKYVWRKFKKFFLWFIIVGLAVDIISRLVSGNELSLSVVANSLYRLLIYPAFSEASFLWYIYILFGYYIISPLFIKLPQLVKTLLCVASLFLAMVPGNPFLASNCFCQYTFFYCLGILCAEWIDEIRGAKTWLWALMSVPFIVFSVWVFSDGMEIGFEYPQLGWWTIVTGSAAIPFFYLLAILFEKTKYISKALTYVSVDCYWIYLLQMFIIWGCLYAVSHTSLRDGAPFWLFITITTILAVVLPILLAETFKKLTNKEKKAGLPSERPAKNTSLK